MFDPHESHCAVSKNGGQDALFLLVHEDGHEVLHLRHVHITPVVTADQHLAHTGHHELG